MPKKPAYDIGEILRQTKHTYNNLPLYKQKIVSDLSICRTSALGGYVYECSNNTCKNKEQAYNSCKNRHCPKCQYRRQQKWIMDRSQELLPVKYFHVVYSVPHELNELFLLNKKELTKNLFSSSSKAIKKMMQNEFQVRTGAVSVLHTWGSNLSLHPHVHSIVPAGGLSLDGKRWIGARKKFLVHVKALSELFKSIYLRRLKKLYKLEQLNFGNLDFYKNKANFNDLLRKLYQKKWVVYAKKSFKREVHVLKYLGRYTHRIAITNHRIKKVTDTNVTFSVKNYKKHGQRELLTLSKSEFIRRFLMHSLLPRMVRVRHTGFLSNAQKEKNLNLIRSLLPHTVRLSISCQAEIEKIIKSLELPLVCGKCKCGKMIVVDELKIGEKFRIFKDTS